MLWLGAMDVLEMAVTEWNYLYNSMPSIWRTWLLIVLLLSVTMALTLWQKTRKRFSLSTLGLSSLIFLAALIGHQRYVQHYDWLQQFPKLKSVSATSSIQAERIEIIGRNFGHPGNEGSVRVGSLEFMIVSWNDERVVVEQPVPSRYFVDDMILTDHHGNELVIGDFAIKDPLEMWQ